MSKPTEPGREGENGEAVAPVEVPRSVQIASRGVRDDASAFDFLSALIADVMTDKVHHRTANTTINALGKMQKLADMRLRYGKQAAPHAGGDVLAVTPAPALVHAEETREQKRLRLLRELAEMG